MIKLAKSTRWLLAFCAAVALGPPASAAEPGKALSIKADPALAPMINSVLSQIAEISSAKVTMSPQGVWVRGNCAGHPVAPAPAPDSGANVTGIQIEALPPCVQSRNDVRTIVRKGETWNSLLARIGLPDSARAAISFSDKAAKPTAGQPQPTRATPPSGQVAYAREVGLWTRFVLKPAGQVADRPAFEALLSSRLGCAGAIPAPKCLTDKGVQILEVDDAKATGKGANGEPSILDGNAGSDDFAAVLKNLTGSKPAPPTFGIGKGGHDRAVTLGRPGEVGRFVVVPGAQLDSRFSGDGPKQPQLDTIFAQEAVRNPWEIGQIQTIARPAMATGTATITLEPDNPGPDLIADPARIATGQWPYDRGLVALELADALKSDAAIRPTTIGVMDIGLATAAGAPLPESVFPVDEFDGGISPGRGIERTDDQSSDVAICPALAAADLERLAKLNDAGFSHGVVTSSLATGLELQGLPGANAVLPRVTFYRLFADPCPPASASLKSTEDIANVVDALAVDKKIINASLLDTSFKRSVGQAINYELSRVEVILVTSAGNDHASLDDNPQGDCPACLRIPNSTMPGDPIAQARTVVVGAATSALVREPSSNFGPRTVQLYAPGTPLGAVDLLDHDASAFTASTSYAAPYVARAIALVMSLAHLEDHPDQAVHRAVLATWPFYGEDGKMIGSGDNRVGVIDLVKVLAGRHYAVEVEVKDRDGVLRRRTYVGDIPNGLHSFAANLCPGERIQENESQAFMFDGAGGGSRVLTMISQRPVTAVPLHYSSRTGQCISSGDLHLHDLAGQDVVIPAFEITLVLAPLKRSP
jgi:hypothetical protein